MDENKKNTKIERIKKHIKDNKKVYITATITGGVCLIVGAAATYVYGVKRNGILTQQVIDSWKFQWKPVTNTNHITQTLSPYGIPLGRPGTPAIDLTTNKRYETIGYMAQHLGLEYNKLRAALANGQVNIDGHDLIRLDHLMERWNQG